MTVGNNQFREGANQNLVFRAPAAFKVLLISALGKEFKLTALLLNVHSKIHCQLCVMAQEVIYDQSPWAIAIKSRKDLFKVGTA